MFGVHSIPGMIKSLEDVPILVPFRIDKAQSGELEREQVLLGRQCQGRRES